MKVPVATILCLAGVFLGSHAAALDKAETDDNRLFAESLNLSLRAYENTQDYECFFNKEELGTDQKLGPAERIFFKFEKPFKLFMAWLNTHKQGVQVVYERGKRRNQLACHQPGLLFGLAQVVFLDQNSPWVKEGSASYDIEDAGIGHFLDSMAECVNDALKKNQLQVRQLSSGAWLHGRTFELTFPASKPDDIYFAKRLVIFFDDTTKLPTRMRLYDWNGQLTGRYAYYHPRLNLGKSSQPFNKLINRYLNKVYNS